MSGLFLLDVSVEPTANPSAVLQDVHRAVKKGVEEAKGKLQYVFKVGAIVLYFSIGHERYETLSLESILAAHL